MTPIPCTVLSRPIVLTPVPGVPQQVLLGSGVWEHALITLSADGHLLIEFAAEDLDELELDLSVLEAASVNPDSAPSRSRVGLDGIDQAGCGPMHFEEVYA